jgi:hypothetical protein
MDSIDFIVNFSQSIVKFIQIVLNDSFKTLLNAFNIKFNYYQIEILMNSK